MYLGFTPQHNTFFKKCITALTLVSTLIYSNICYWFISTNHVVWSYLATHFLFLGFCGVDKDRNMCLKICALQFGIVSRWLFMMLLLVVGFEDVPHWKAMLMVDVVRLSCWLY